MTIDSPNTARPILVVALCFVINLFAQAADARFFVHFIDVGQADAILIMDDRVSCVILIDSGDTRYPGSSKNFKQYLTDHLKVGSQIDLAIATHPHNDHIGSMQWVFENYHVRHYVDNGQRYGSKRYLNLMEIVEQKVGEGLTYSQLGNISAQIKRVCGAGGPQISILYPASGFDPEMCDQDPNNCSVVTKLSIGSITFLFPGDAEEEEEQLLLADDQIKVQLNADVLKVGHHGSDTSSSEEFLDAVTPSWMVISAGEKNVGTNVTYKHPRMAIVQELLTFAGRRQHTHMVDAYDATTRHWEQMRIWGHLYITADDGTIVLSTDGTTILKE